MTNETFNEILERRIDQMKATLGRKAGEYASGGDRHARVSMLRVSV